MKDPEFREGWQNLKLPALASIKYDGEFQKVTSSGCLNKYGRFRQFSFLKSLPSNYAFYGELIVGEGKDFYSEFLPNKTNPDEKIFKLVIFDVELDFPFFVRRALLREVVEETEYIKLARTTLVKTESEAKRYFETVTEDGYEGAVFYPKDRNFWVKVKKVSTLDLAVLGIRKDKYSVAIGYPPKTVLGHASLVPHPEILEAIKKEEIVEETEEDFLIRPKMVVEVKAYGRTKEGRLRSPQILRVREDKDAGSIRGDI